MTITIRGITAFQLLACLLAWVAGAAADTDVPIEPKHVAEFARILELEPDEKQALQTLYESYAATLSELETQRQETQRKRWDEYSKKLEEFKKANKSEYARDMALKRHRVGFETERPIIELNTSFLADVAALARNETLTARLDRARRRHATHWATHLYRIDLIDIAYHTDGVPPPDAACVAFLEKYQQELDVLLSELQRVHDRGSELQFQGAELGASGELLKERDLPLPYRQYLLDQTQTNVRLGNFAYRTMKVFRDIANDRAVVAVDEQLPHVLVCHTKSPSVEKLCRDALENPALAQNLVELVKEERRKYRVHEDRLHDAWVKLTEREFATGREHIAGNISLDEWNKALNQIADAKELQMQAIDKLRSEYAERIKRIVAGG